MKIQVLQSHIDNGARIYKWETNPIALALKDAGFKNTYANWGSGVISCSNTESGSVHSMPVEVKQWLIRYDNFITVEPFEFEMIGLDCVLRADRKVA